MGASVCEAEIVLYAVHAELLVAERDCKAARVKRNAFLKVLGRPYQP